MSRSDAWADEGVEEWSAETSANVDEMARRIEVAKLLQATDDLFHSALVDAAVEAFDAFTSTEFILQIVLKWMFSSLFGDEKFANVRLTSMLCMVLYSLLSVWPSRPFILSNS